ncbi:MAG: Carbamate kinase 1 [Chlamydiae bacterium]|nr:Carbamate kinase 1 [Chlamydiota bacterium]
MLVLVALGGNALIQRGESLEEEVQLKNVKKAAKALKEIADKHALALCHGNGPQVGLLALQSAAYTEVKPYSLDVLVAESQGMIGYLMQNGLYNEGLRSTVTLLTQVVVDANDSSFQTPSKPIGPVYDKETALQLAKEKNWDVAPDGDYYRRVVASPIPKEIVEIEIVRDLIEKNYVPIFCGGGGVAVVRDADGKLIGKEAVIDKDRVSSLAAENLNADLFLVLTDVEGVCENWGTDKQRTIRSISPKQLRDMDFAKGSMGPKVEAVCHFVEKTNKTAAIGSLFHAEALLKEEAGTWIKPNVDKITYY